MLLNQKPKHVVDYLAANYRGVLDVKNICSISLKLVGPYLLQIEFSPFSILMRTCTEFSFLYICLMYLIPP